MLLTTNYEFLCFDHAFNTLHTSIEESEICIVQLLYRKKSKLLPLSLLSKAKLKRWENIMLSELFIFMKFTKIIVCGLHRIQN